jgi:dynein heavy chain
MAGSLKRANPNDPGDIVLIRAMRDANIPKFLKDDVLLFNAIVQDLFPTAVVAPNEYGEM